MSYEELEEFERLFTMQMRYLFSGAHLFTVYQTTYSIKPVVKLLTSN